MTAKFYDHASNHTNAAVAIAVARVRRESLAEGTAYRVEFTNSKGESWYWDGGAYDALSLAKDLAFNRSTKVSLIRPNGTVMTAEEIRASKY